MKARGTGLKVPLLAFPGRRLWTHSKVGKVVVGGSFPSKFWVTGSPPNSDSPEPSRRRSRIGSCYGNEALGTLRKAKAERGDTLLDPLSIHS